MRKTWIFSTQSNVVIVAVAYACSFFFVGDNAFALEPPAITEKPAYFNAAKPTLVIGEELERSVHFQSLRTRWHTERGITSSIQEMCTTPAYLTIMAMGKHAVPLLISQLRLEGDKPDHWFFALHYITGADPVPPEDRGKMAKMSKAWIAWADEQTENAR